MALSDILKSFTAQATAAGQSEEGYYQRSVLKAQAGDTTDLDAIRAQAVTDTDTAAITEIDVALADSGTVTAFNGKGIVTISPSAGDNADYTFTGTSSYVSAIADAKIANGGTLLFMSGTYTFDTNPSWRNGIIHFGAGGRGQGSGELTTVLKLPATFTSTGDVVDDGMYRFEHMRIEPVSGTHKMRFTGGQTTSIREVQFDGDLRWEPQGNFYRNYIQNCDMGYNSGPVEYDWDGAWMQCHDSWFFGHPVLFAGNEQVTLRGVQSFQTRYTSNSNISGLLIASDCQNMSFSRTGTGTMRDVKISGSTGPIPDWVEGKFNINGVGSNPDYIDIGDKGVAFNVSWDSSLNRANSLRVRLTASVAVNIVSGSEKGRESYLQLVQDGTGSRTITSWPGNVTWLSGSAPTLSVAANATDLIVFWSDGTTNFGRKVS